MCNVTVATRLCTVLAQLLTPAIVLRVHSEYWCASAPVAASQSANSFLVPGPQGPFVRAAFDLHDEDCRSVVLNSHPLLVPKITALLHGVCPPLWAVDTKYSLSEIGTKGVLRGLTDLGTVRLGPVRPPPLPKTKDGVNTSVKSSTATPQPQRRSTGSREKGPPVQSRNMIRQLFSAHSFNKSLELCFTRGSTTSHARGTSIQSAGTIPLVLKQGLVFFSRLARWKKCGDFRMLSCGMALITEQDQIWWKESSRAAPHLTQHSSNST